MCYASAVEAIREDPLRHLVKELDRLLDLPVNEEVREMLWALLSDVNEYRRKKSQSEGQDSTFQK